MHLQTPFTVVTQTVDGEVLAVLAGAEVEFTTPQIRAIAGGRCEAGLRNACVRLADQGIVSRRRAGNAWMYSLN